MPEPSGTAPSFSTSRGALEKSRRVFPIVLLSLRVPLPADTSLSPTIHPSMLGFLRYRTRVTRCDRDAREEIKHSESSRTCMRHRHHHHHHTGRSVGLQTEENKLRKPLRQGSRSCHRQAEISRGFPLPVPCPSLSELNGRRGLPLLPS